MLSKSIQILEPLLRALTLSTLQQQRRCGRATYLRRSLARGQESPGAGTAQRLSVTQWSALPIPPETVRSVAGARQGRVGQAGRRPTRLYRTREVRIRW